jgi:hypothetical protein
MSYVRNISIFITLLFTLLIIAENVEAAEYYVATNGSDSNNGSQAAPFKTFERAIAPLQPGDTLYIRGGTYTDQINLQDSNKSGRAGAYITIAGYPGETVILQHAGDKPNGYGAIKARGNRGYFIFENFTIDSVNEAWYSGWDIAYGNHDFILRNLEIKNGTSTGLSIIQASNIQVINCRIHDSKTAPEKTGAEGPSRHYGFYIRSVNNMLIEGSQIYNQPGGGIQAFPGPVNNLVIRNNVIHHNNNLVHSNVPGILVQGDSSYVKDGVGSVRDVQIYNNIVYSNCVDQPSGAKSCGGIRIVGDNTRGTKVWNNTVYGNKGYGVIITPKNYGENANVPPIDTVLQNNIVFGNTTTQITEGGANTTQSNNLTTDPKFVNAAAGDFGLQEGSPALDKGITLAAVPKDFTGKARPEGAAYDLGAFEGAGSRANAFPAVGGGITPIGGAGGAGSGGSFGLGNCLQ